MAGALAQASEEPDDEGPSPMPMPAPSQQGALSSASNDDLNAVSERAMAVQRASRRLAALKYANIDLPALGAARGFLAPTKSGHFSESLGNAAEGVEKGISGDLHNQLEAEQAEGGFLSNQLAGLNLQGYRDYINATRPGGSLSAGPGGTGGAIQPNAGYPVPPVYDIVSLGHQAQLLSRINSPQAAKMAQSMFKQVEDALSTGKYVGIDGNIYNIPHAIQAMARAEYGRAAADTLGKNLGSIRAPAVLGPTSLGDIGPQILSDGVTPPGATGRPSPSPAALAPVPAPLHPAVSTAPLAPLTPPATPDDSAPIALRPKAGVIGDDAQTPAPMPAPAPLVSRGTNIPPGQPGPGPGPHGQIEPTVTPLGGGRSVVNLPPSEAQTAAYIGGLPGEGETIGKDMGKWYNDMRNGYLGSVGIDQNLETGFKALQGFQPGATVPEQVLAGRFIKAFGGDPSHLKLADPASAQELNKAMTNMIFSAIRQVSSRPAYLEFQMLGNAYPNETLEPEAALKILTTLKAKMNWERGLFETVEGWRHDPGNRGKSLQDFNLVGYLKSNPMPRYEDDALIDYVNRGGVRGVKNWTQLLNNQGRSGEAPAPAGKAAPQIILGKTVVPGKNGKPDIYAGADGKWHTESFAGPEYKP